MQSLLVSVRAYCDSCAQPLLLQVYERAPEFRICGAGVAMSVNGLKAIKAVSPELLAEFEAKGEHFDHVEQLDQHGEPACLSALMTTEMGKGPSEAATDLDGIYSIPAACTRATVRGHMM